jgi:hypothetical protein
VNLDERQRLRRIVQGTPEWHEGRRGCITASMAARLLAVTPTTVAAFAEKLRGELVERSIANVPAVALGREREPDARFAYSMLEDVEVETVGLLVHPALALVRCSPDFLVPSLRRGGEVKCPSGTTGVANHWRALAGTMPASHVPQVQFSLWAGADECDEWDLVSWLPEFPAGKRIAVVRSRPRADVFRLFEAKARLVLPYLDGGNLYE